MIIKSFMPDVSHYQGPVNHQALFKAGTVSGLITKLSEGISYTDPQGANNLHGALNHGKVAGAYHFLTSADPVAQVDNFARALAYAGVSPYKTMIMLDVENSSVNAYQVNGWLKEAGKRWPDKRIVIYTGRSFWANLTNNLSLDPLRYPLWVAGYRPNLYVPGTGTYTSLYAKVGNSDHGGTPFANWGTPSLMQYSDKAIFPGISAACDANAIYVDTPTLMSYQTNGGIDMSLTKADAALVADTIINRDVNLAMGGSTPNSDNRLGMLVEKAATPMTATVDIPTLASAVADELVKRIAALLVTKP
jgi:GH25 family lysozyme M1 (1,4-beta-N-acetylmuramidase)